MKLGPYFALSVVLISATALAQQPPDVAQALEGIVSEPGAHTAVTFDHDMLQGMGAMFGDNRSPVAGLESITVENYRYHEPAF